MAFDPIDCYTRKETYDLFKKEDINENKVHEKEEFKSFMSNLWHKTTQRRALDDLTY